MTKKLSIFASGSGTNAQRITEYFADNKEVEISYILSNYPNAYVLKRAENLGVPWLVFNRREFSESDLVLNFLNTKKIDFIALAGFLWLMPEQILAAFPDRIINIHPALLPNYGGKGMFGMKVHEAVINAKEEESGISIHYVNQKYDEGKLIFQAKCQIEKEDTAEILAQKIHKLEHEHFPLIIEKILFS